MSATANFDTAVTGRFSRCDDWCGYTTLRTVKLRDWRLGVLYYSFLFLVFSYIIGYNVVYRQLYRKSVDIVGTSRIQLRPPEPQYRVAPENTLYCDTGMVRFKGEVRYPCQYWDNFDAVFPSLEDSGVFLSTRVTKFSQALPDGCLDQSTEICQFQNIANTTFYIADIELSTALIDHMMIAPAVGISRASLDMSGGIFDMNGRALDPCQDYAASHMPCPPNVRIGVPHKPDIVPIKTLLRAAGVTGLDQPAGVPSALNETLRYGGVVLVLTIEYSNYFGITGSWFESVVAYRYLATAVPNAEFKGEEVLPGPGVGGKQRTVLDRHGVRVVVRQSGTVGTFDGAGPAGTQRASLRQVLLLSLTSALGLLAVVNTLVDLLATSFLPHRAVYAQYMQVRTVEFSDLRRLSPEALAEFRHRDLVNPPPPFLPAHTRPPASAGPAPIEDVCSRLLPT